jgi:2-polyprenyl-3-methyl-5-hydroxy-6-metoxy-1,4-benzoquinol methylase
LKYDFELDLSDENESHALMVQLIGANKRVLEVGCATGYMSSVLARRGCRVVGLEIEPDAAREARQHCEDVVVGDVETLDLAATFGPSTFDVVVFGDVLEHLNDPLTVLRKARPLLVPEGYVVCSIPNIAHGAVRLALLQGRFEYREYGLLDESHVRFFTRDSIEEMFRQAGLALAELRRTTAPIWETEINLRREDFPPELVAQLESDPEAATYQFVAKAVVDNALRAVDQLHAREQAQRTEILALRREVQRLGDGLARCQEDLASEAETQAETRNELMTSRQEAEELRTFLAAREDQIDNLERRWQALERRFPVRLYRRLRRMGRPGP